MLSSTGQGTQKHSLPLPCCLNGTLVYESYSHSRPFLELSIFLPCCYNDSLPVTNTSLAVNNTLLLRISEGLPGKSGAAFSHRHQKKISCILNLISERRNEGEASMMFCSKAGEPGHQTWNKRFPFLTALSQGTQSLLADICPNPSAKFWLLCNIVPEEKGPHRHLYSFH